MKKFLKDKYSRVRGGTSKLLNLTCTKCKYLLCSYQKDGPGILKRIYFDRIIGLSPNDKKSLQCPNCKELIGVPIIYKKENRKAYRLFVGAISKQSVK